MLRRVIQVLLAFLVSTQWVFSQVDAWERVKLIEPGKGISVALKSGRTVTGKMSEWRAEGVTVLRGQKTESFSKDEIAQVHMLAGMSRGKRAAWAFGIGAGVGAGLYAAGAAASDLGSDSGEYVALFVVGGALLIGGISAGIAALIPRHKELIYQAQGTPAKP